MPTGLRLITSLAVLCCTLTGCTVCMNLRRTVWDEPKAFSHKADRARSLETYRVWAERAWREVRGECADVATRPEYAMGFRDGFVDYVFAGGTGEPPPVPPRKFWNVELRSPAGHEAAQQWFAGYRHGAQVAREGGYRARATIPSSVFGLEPVARLPGSGGANWAPVPDGERVEVIPPSLPDQAPATGAWEELPLILPTDPTPPDNPFRDDQP